LIRDLVGRDDVGSDGVEADVASAVQRRPVIGGVAVPVAVADDDVGAGFMPSDKQATLAIMLPMMKAEAPMPGAHAPK
jgi:hypothetical protein